ncbi:MAG: hypothetical protein K2Y18_08920 [Alphaproteobacteria bacterium]|nr:hypothetical protein [Alphaproteobacteria bacterium]
MFRSLLPICSLTIGILTVLPIHGIVIDLKELLENDNERTQKVQNMFRNLTECQIGGTHTYGNTTIIKKGEGEGKLNPAILIINPDLKAHNVEDQSISVS